MECTAEFSRTGQVPDKYPLNYPHKYPCKFSEFDSH